MFIAVIPAIFGRALMAMSNTPIERAEGPKPMAVCSLPSLGDDWRRHYASGRGFVGAPETTLNSL